ncbi:hypothetical protein FIBSPDRAFT_244371 [Athelia psychrophila]|uniref:Uncharacterized protein n=1 Tax=Athelia psychrophila TaxID=1759441 RepID=A0A166RRW1_9AGAM|nr:hypothetical protein FIBSPDRAFT_244371 [Fibularhizoctonia sp. CBS 109695]
MVELEPTIDTSPAIRASGIDTLPNELLSDIFTMGAASQPLDVEQLPFALLVSSISRRWREAAISSPPLWSQLSLTANPRSASWCAQLFLPRSGAHPLDISINMLLEQGLFGLGSVMKIMQFLLPHCARWRKLCIRVGDDNENFVIRSMVQYIPAPLLQHFEFVYEGECIGEGRSHAPFFDLGAPALTSVKLRGMCLECAPHLANLTSFRFDSKATSVTQSQMESIVAASPALRVLHLRLKGFEASGSGSIHIPSLRNLSLNFRAWDHNTEPHTEPLHIFAIMVAPALKSLELVWLPLYDGSDLNALFQNFPNYPRPQTLKLSHSIYDSEACDNLLGHFPTVTSLYLLDTAQEPKVSLLPALKYITYHLDQHVWGNLDDEYMKWLCRHVQDCHGTPRAMESVRMGSSACELARLGVSGEAHYRTLRDLVDLVELPDDADSLKNSWSSDDEVEGEEEYGESEEEDDYDDLEDYWEDYLDPEDEWESD